MLEVWGEGSSVVCLSSEERASRYCCSYSFSAKETDDSSATTASSSIVTGVAISSGKPGTTTATEGSRSWTCLYLDC